ncbi:MAG: GntR family transcriptional regulator [Eubacterium sp.]|nr:GntR family transcriptional regulator [Eubacterium sp.]
MPVPHKIKKNADVLSSKERVYRGVAKWIISGVLTPGEKIVEADIADYFSVSRTPVREAMLQLADENLIRMYPSKGSYVTKPNKKDADKIYEALGAINREIALLADEKITEKDLTELRKRGDAFAEAYHRKEFSLLEDLDQNFHQYIADIAGNPYLKQMSLVLERHAYRFEYLLSEKMSNRDQSIKDHTALIKAFEQHDTDSLRAIANDNWVNIYKNQIRDLLPNE